ncbi:uncharacterized protein PGTG_22114 [Puccinia graminis f. sp. tritici CRL 75-36-700-3]|uniref:Uncharacterized protein n=1 Tax=Puccinia graminis f. sp. tritici (strain CRL 75-36-700-3 / race SCCL) TaxID=418459 RepID=H6QT91_PUCGT|nr:uncharacterized protein PGTG_22114 [Puccinia graminis f. sp. tritici CRL 75-36-700-3]EHS64059.1 hypothetical protein PGTG_22114 [Puccinia graminis f. sp. tritici CRL 75-36-700-3]
MAALGSGDVPSPGVAASYDHELFMLGTNWAGSLNLTFRVSIGSAHQFSCRPVVAPEGLRCSSNASEEKLLSSSRMNKQVLPCLVK